VRLQADASSQAGQRRPVATDATPPVEPTIRDCVLRPRSPIKIGLFKTTIVFENILTQLTARLTDSRSVVDDRGERVSMPTERRAERATS
jgi:hypothetical protein